MSPSNNIRGSSNDETSPERPGLIVPFPKLHLTDTLRGQRHRSRHNKRHDGQAVHSNGETSVMRVGPTSPISFPKSHIHRTPSELQLEQSQIQAEYSDVMMYTRLVKGMTEHGAALHTTDSSIDQNQGHVLSRKSLMGVVECRQRPILEEGHEEEEDCHRVPSNVTGAVEENIQEARFVNSDCGWSVGYSFEDALESARGARNSINSTQERNLSSTALPQGKRHEKHYHEVSATSSQCQADENEEEEDCVFALEM